MEARASEALVSAVAEAERAVLASDVEYADATSWLLAGLTMSLWTLATSGATLGCWRPSADVVTPWSAASRLKTETAAANQSVAHSVQAEVPGFVEFYQQGGPCMHWILVVACIGLFVVSERYWQLRAHDRADAGRLFAIVRARMLAGDTEGAVRVCGQRFSAVGHVMLAGLMAGLDPVRAEAAVRAAQLELAPALTRWFPLIRSLATIAVLLGLLGTVFGMVTGFHYGGVTVSADQRATAFAMGISIALNTTGFGLLMAIPLLGSVLWLKPALGRLTAEAELYGAKIVNLISVCARPEGPRLGPYR